MSTHPVQEALFAPDPQRCRFCKQLIGHGVSCPNGEPVPRRSRWAHAETNKGVAQVTRNANQEWLEVAFFLGARLARTVPEFTTADIDLIMQRDFRDVLTHDKRSMGAVARRLMREKLVEKTDRWLEDPRPNCHNGACRLLRSLVFVAVAA